MGPGLARPPPGAAIRGGSGLPPSPWRLKRLPPHRGSRSGCRWAGNKRSVLNQPPQTSGKPQRGWRAEAGFRLPRPAGPRMAALPVLPGDVAVGSTAHTRRVTARGINLLRERSGRGRVAQERRSLSLVTRQSRRNQDDKHRAPPACPGLAWTGAHPGPRRRPSARLGPLTPPAPSGGPRRPSPAEAAAPWGVWVG